MNMEVKKKIETFKNHLAQNIFTYYINLKLNRTIKE